MSAASVAGHRGGVCVEGVRATSNEYDTYYSQRLSHYRLELDDVEEDDEWVWVELCCGLVTLNDGSMVDRRVFKMYVYNALSSKHAVLVEIGQ